MESPQDAWIFHIITAPWYKSFIWRSYCQVNKISSRLCQQVLGKVCGWSSECSVKWFLQSGDFTKSHKQIHSIDVSLSYQRRPSLPTSETFTFSNQTDSVDAMLTEWVSSVLVLNGVRLCQSKVKKKKKKACLFLLHCIVKVGAMFRFSVNKHC